LRETGTVYHVSDTDDKEESRSMSSLLVHTVDGHEDPAGELTVSKANESAHSALDRHYWI